MNHPLLINNKNQTYLRTGKPYEIFAPFDIAIPPNKTVDVILGFQVDPGDCQGLTYTNWDLVRDGIFMVQTNINDCAESLVVRLWNSDLEFFKKEDGKTERNMKIIKGGSLLGKMIFGAKEAIV